MSNRFADCKTVQELIYQTVGAGSMAWEHVDRAGVFDDVHANAVAKDCLQRLLELLNVAKIEIETDTEANLSVEFKSFIRKPFRVSAIEITVENIHELADLVGEFKEDADSGPYIIADPEKVPTVNRVVPGYWITQMGKNLRCYSAKAFHEQFAELTPSLDRLMRKVDEDTKEYIGV
jgi:hypothetical protein